MKTGMEGVGATRLKSFDIRGGGGNYRSNSRKKDCVHVNNERMNDRINKRIICDDCLRA